MSTKPRLFLLDANIVIHLHELGLWAALIQVAEVYLPSIVAFREVQFFDAKDGQTYPTSLNADIEKDLVQIRTATSGEMADTLTHFDAWMSQCIDPGELEALTLLRHWGESPPEFCTADAKACEALCLLDLDHLAVSLEEILGRVGRSVPLKEQFQQAKLEEWLERGRVNRVQGIGTIPKKDAHKKRRPKS